MFTRALGQVLPLGHALGLLVAFNHRHGNTTLPEFNGQPHANRATADDQHLTMGLVGVAHFS